MNSVQTFYDDLAPDYVVLHADWDASVHRQGTVLATLIERLSTESGTPVRTVLDATCGIGTQAIGLALAGYTVTGTDLSPGAVAEARINAARLGARATFAPADIRALAAVVPGPFDAVIAADNALAHLASANDLTAALASARSVLSPGGLFLASLRDYDAIRALRPAGEAPRVSGPVGARHMSAQAWEWEDGAPFYRAHLFVSREGPAGWATRHLETRLWAISRLEFGAAATAAGLGGGRWIEPAESGFYQPIFVAWAP